jgi:hypothetical protein
VPRRSALLLALALIGGPILCGAAYFMATRPAQAPGVYVELVDGVYPLPACAAGTDISSTAAVTPGDIRSLFIVLPDAASAAANAETAKLYLRVVNHAEPQTDYGRTPLPATVARMSSRVYRVRSDRALRWDPQGLTNTVYRQALSRMLGNRATTEVLLELEVPERGTASCRYALTLGPPPSLPDSDAKWLVPAAERRP